MKNNSSMIYCIDIKDSNYNDIHPFISEYVKNNEFISSLKTQTHFFVHCVSNNISIGLQSLSLIKIPQYYFDKNKEVYLEANVAFDNRHYSGKKVIYKTIYQDEALKIFLKKTGIIPMEKKHCRSYFLGIVREKKFQIRNAFKISGYFKIEDLNLFNKALHNGIGSRKSYGFGLILIKEIIN